MHTQVRFIDKNQSSLQNTTIFAKFQDYIQLMHHFSNNVQVFTTFNGGFFKDL